MTKSDTPLKNIDTKRAKKELRQPIWAGDKEIVSFDTETHEGDIFCVTTSSNEKTFVYEDNGNILSESKLFQLLTQKYFRNTLNVWFNIGFDAEVILKVLPNDVLRELQVTNQVEYADKRITYLPNKYLRIETGIDNDIKGKRFLNCVDYYDVAQLFQNNLKGAIEEWLNGDYAKNEQDIDTTKFDNKKYIIDNYNRIIEYAKNDAKLTRLITEKLIHIAEEINIPCGKPFSTGYLAENYLKNTLNQKPFWGCSEMQSMAWKTYVGGRFEVFKRGNIGEVVGPDINSAYPFIMSQLPDPGTLDWCFHHLKDKSIPSISEIESADYGFIEAYITTSNNRIQPFAVKMDNIVKYPILNNYRITVLKDTFIWALNNGYIKDYELIKCFLGNKNGNTRYPFRFIPDLYEQRKVWENKGKEKRAWLLKIILNSMYGKLAQTQYKVELMGNDTKITDVPDHVSIHPGPNNELPHLKSLESGSLFNPFLATYITGLTRLELLKTVHKYDLINDVILFATDSIMVEKEAYYNSEIQELTESKNNDYKDQLGQWEFDYEGKAFVIGSGIYEVELEDCINKDCEFYKTNNCSNNSHYIKKATRGFKETSFESFRNKAKELNNQEPIIIEHNRPYTLGEAIHQTKIGVTDIGAFFKGDRKLHPDFDKKRDWDNANPSWRTLLHSIEDSKSLLLS